MDLHNVQQRTSNTLQRLFKMSFVPAGFWERFIARMLISLTEMDLQVGSGQNPLWVGVSQGRLTSGVVLVQFLDLPRRTTHSQPHRHSSIYSFSGSEKKNRCTFRVRRSQTIYWKEGLLVTFDGGHLRSEEAELLLCS